MVFDAIPLPFALLLALAAATLVPAGVLLTQAVPVLSGIPVPDILTALFAIVTLTALGWWGQAGFNLPTRWQDLQVLILPVLFSLAALLVGGIHITDPLMISIIAFNYVLGAFMEEAMFRGLVLRTLLPTGTRKSICFIRRWRLL